MIEKWALTGLAAAGFTVPLVSVLGVLNFIPSAEDETEHIN